jgi:hypothetical protein
MQSLAAESRSPVKHCQHQREVKKMAPNRSVEATSNGWPRKASYSFFALCGQPSAAPHLER